METIKNTIKLGFTNAFFVVVLSAVNISAQILHVDSVTVDSVWNSDSSWYDGNGILQQRVSRDCNITFFPQSEGMARMFIAISIDSGKTWAPSPNPLIVFNNALSSTFITGQKAIIMVRVLGGDRSGVVFKMTARQAAPVIVGNPKKYFFIATTDLIPGQNVSEVLNVKLISDTSSSGNGFCTLQKIYWKTGDGSVYDSTAGSNDLTWTWYTKVPAGATGQKRGVIVCAEDKNGILSVPETLVVQFTLSDHSNDSLAVRAILDANNLQTVAVAGVVSYLDKTDTSRIGELNLQGKNITVIPKDIGQLTGLKALRLDSNSIASLPPEIENCSSLRFLSIAKNKLTGLPSEIGKLKSLTNLNVSQNVIAALPDSIGKCSSLGTIKLQDNQLTTLPASIMGCPVIYIPVSNNKLCTVSDALKNWLDLLAEPDWAANQNCN